MAGQASTGSVRIGPAAIQDQYKLSVNKPILIIYLIV